MATTTTLKKKPTVSKEEREEALAKALVAMDIDKEAKKVLDERIKANQQVALDQMAGLRIESTTFKDSTGRNRKAARVQGSTLVIDERSLAKRIGATLWNKVSTRVLDRKKLDAFIASGEIKATTLAACATEKENAAYVKIT